MRTKATPLQTAVMITFLCSAATVAYGQARSKPADPALRYLLEGSALFNQGKFTESIDLLNKATLLELDSPSPRQQFLAAGFSLAGSCRLSLGQSNLALEHYQKSLTINKKLGDDKTIAIALSNMGSAYNALGNYEEAIKNLKQALAIHKRMGNLQSQAVSLNTVGLTYNSWGHHDKALKYYQKALRINRENGAELGEANNLNNIGTLYFKKGEYKKTIDYFEQALVLLRKLGKPTHVARALSNIGVAYRSLCIYDKALTYHQQALAVNRELGFPAGVASELGNIGLLYQKWRKHDKALEYFEQAIDINTELGNDKAMINDLNNMGLAYVALYRPEDALWCYQKALVVARKLEQYDSIKNLLGNISEAHRRRGEHAKALEYGKQALEMSRKYKDQRGVANGLNGIGALYAANGNRLQAIGYYQQALSTAKKIKYESLMGTCYNNMGVEYSLLGQNGEAAVMYQKAVDSAEALRLTATGEARMVYLADQLFKYQSLVQSLLKNSEYYKAFDATEIASAKHLGELLVQKNKIPVDATMTAKLCQRRLQSHEAIVKFSNMTWNDTLRMVITDEFVGAAGVPKKNFVAEIEKLCGDEINRTYRDLHGLRSNDDTSDITEGARESLLALEKIINYYRTFLSSPVHAVRYKRGIKTKRNQAKQSPTSSDEVISRKLYTFLFGDIEKYIENKTELIILPDGILGFLPLEALVMPDGRRMGEKYSIRYAQSMTVQELIRKRKAPKFKISLLAMGGAVYDAKSLEQNIVTSHAELDELTKQVRSGASRGASIKDHLARLGYGEWQNLPGTLREAKGLHALINDSTLISGEDLTEGNIKMMSVDGRLAKYEVIHIATHGLVVPEVPELSAIVLSQEIESSEDGYLRACEIAELDIKADFVCLSACETGLGKIYGGEGVVGLTQSFLVAGANGLCVSLWQVADESTKTFMMEMYKTALEKDMSFAQAITDTKRRFISGEFGDKLKDPYYWAPFVYYGTP